MKVSSTLENCIYELKKTIDNLKELYLQSDKPADKKDRELFEKVKRETTSLFELNNRCAELAEEYVRNSDQNKVFPLQIQNTKDNTELVILHSYYIDVPKKRYMELHNSIHYVLDQLIMSIEADRKEQADSE